MSHPGSILEQYIHAGDLLAERYRIDRLIGWGAYGGIFLALDEIAQEQVAIKAIAPEREQVSATAVDRFRREMRIIRSLMHPHIIALFDFGQTAEGVIFMVLEYVDGKTLEAVAHEGPMSSEDVYVVARQIASALGSAHDKGIVHRDLKPANVMLTRDHDGYCAKVLDFGMAKLIGQLGNEPVKQLTREGVAVGTPRYIAPEQARGLQVGSWTDMYALGLLIYEMYTGKRAVKADSVETAVRAHVSAKPLELEELNLVPKEDQPFLWKLLEKDPKKRFQDANAFLDALDRVHPPSGEQLSVQTERAKLLAERTDPDPFGDFGFSKVNQSPLRKLVTRSSSEHSALQSRDSKGTARSTKSGSSPFALKEESVWVPAGDSDALRLPESLEIPSSHAPPSRLGARSLSSLSGSSVENRPSDLISHGESLSDPSRVRPPNSTRPRLRPRDIDVDSERYHQFAPPSAKAGEPEKEEVALWDRALMIRPISARQWLEAAFTPVLAYAAFVFFTAHLFRLENSLRVVVGLAPVGIILFASIILPAVNWRMSFFRLCNITNALVIVAAHFIGPVRLMQELLRDPAWFLYDSGPGTIWRGLEWLTIELSKYYGLLLLEIVGFLGLST